MNVTAIIITIVMHLVLTGFSFYLFKTVIKLNPEKLTKLFFLIMGIRFVFPLAFYAAFLWGMSNSGNSADDLKIFTIFYLLIYMLFLAIDTAYFYCTLKQLDNKNNKE